MSTKEWRETADWYCAAGPLRGSADRRAGESWGGSTPRPRQTLLRQLDRKSRERRRLLRLQLRVEQIAERHVQHIDRIANLAESYGPLEAALDGGDRCLVAIDG